MRIRNSVIQISLLIATVILLGATATAIAESDTKLSKGETVYVSVYSNVFVGSVKEKFQLSSMLSVRNTDPKYPITIMKADYYNTNGRNVKSYIFQPVKLNPLASKYYFVEPQDERGGEGANFLVKWTAEQNVNQPIIETIMLNLFRQQGLSFRFRAKSSPTIKIKTMRAGNGHQNITIYKNDLNPSCIKRRLLEVECDIYTSIRSFVSFA